MTELEFVKWAMLALMGLTVWFMKRTLDKNEERITVLEQNISIIKSEYLHKDDFKEFKVELRSMFEEIKKDIRAIKGHDV